MASRLNQLIEGLLEKLNLKATDRRHGVMIGIETVHGDRWRAFVKQGNQILLATDPWPSPQEALDDLGPRKLEPGDGSETPVDGRRGFKSKRGA